MSNLYIIGPLSLWLVSQLIKFAINLVRGQTDLRYLFAAGGMPSAHAAVVCSLAMIALLDQGFASPIFGVTVILAAIVMYDSFGVRRSSGEQARVLNRLMRDLQGSGALRSEGYQSLREIFGHKPHEVVAGAVLGILGGLLFEWHRVSERFAFLTQKLTTEQMRWYGYGLVLFVVAVVLVRFWQGRQVTAKSAKRTINRLVVFSAVGFVVLVIELFSASQNIAFLQTCLAAFLAWVLVLVPLIFIYSYYGNRLMEDKRAQESSARKLKWLKKAGRRS